VTIASFFLLHWKEVIDFQAQPALEEILHLILGAC